MTDWIRKYIHGLLPFYCNNSLKSFQRRFVDLWLRYDPAAREEVERLRKLSTAVRGQAEQQPDPKILKLVQARISSQDSPEPLFERRRKWAFGLAAISALALVLVLIWQVLPPGITLLWSVGSGQPETFRIYRADVIEAEANVDQDFQLIRELPVEANEPEYSFLDIQSMPGQSYVYRVDVMGPSGAVTDSRTVTGSSLTALPGQLTILLVSIIGGLLVWTLIMSRRLHLSNSWMNQLI